MTRPIVIKTGRKINPNNMPRSVVNCWVEKPSPPICASKDSAINGTASTATNSNINQPSTPSKKRKTGINVINTNKNPMEIMMTPMEKPSPPCFWRVTSLPQRF